MNPQAMTYVVAELSLELNGKLVRRLQVSVIDAALDFRATEATQAEIMKAEEKWARQQVEKASQLEVPKL